MSAFPSELRALLSARAYPHPVRSVELIETHVSWVLLSGEFTYKIKRPVEYAFVDLRSPERRAFLCEEEVRLNRRFAPELYIGVCPIVRRDGEARIGGAGAVIEHAVRMRQFPREEQLDRLLAAGRIEPAELEAFGRELARLHAALPAAEAAQRWGRPSALGEIIRDNVEECVLAGRALGELASLEGLEARVAARVARTIPLLSARFAAYRVRECHGDLHARNLVRLGRGLVAFDCLEFDPALRWTDVADEIACLLADLEVRQAPWHAHAFVGAYLTESGDYQACGCLPLFVAHRALVRGKVAALGALQGAAPAALNAARGEFQAYLECAQRSLTPRPPRLVLMAGLSGSGKTWLAQRLAPPLQALLVRSDVERKRLAGLSPADRSASAVAEGLYTESASQSVYERLLQCAADILSGGFTAIVDATFGRRAQRAEFAALAARLGARICMVHCHAPPEILEARVRARHERADDASEADLQVLAWQRANFEPIAPEEGFEVLEATTAEADVVERLSRRLAAQLTVSAL